MDYFISCLIKLKSSSWVQRSSAQNRGWCQTMVSHLLPRWACTPHSLPPTWGINTSLKSVRSSQTNSRPHSEGLQSPEIGSVSPHSIPLAISKQKNCRRRWSSPSHITLAMEEMGLLRLKGIARTVVTNRVRVRSEDFQVCYLQQSCSLLLICVWLSPRQKILYFRLWKI